MLKIPNEFKKNEYNYSLMSRVGNIALYRQSRAGKIYAYEVHIVRCRKQKRIALIKNKKVTFKLGEYLASNEEFGYYAWSFVDYNDAMRKFEELVLNNTGGKDGKNKEIC